MSPLGLCSSFKGTFFMPIRRQMKKNKIKKWLEDETGSSFCMPFWVGYVLFCKAVDLDFTAINSSRRSLDARTVRDHFILCLCFHSVRPEPLLSVIYCTLYCTGCVTARPISQHPTDQRRRQPAIAFHFRIAGHTNTRACNTTRLLVRRQPECRRNSMLLVSQRERRAGGSLP